MRAHHHIVQFSLSLSPSQIPEEFSLPTITIMLLAALFLCTTSADINIPHKTMVGGVKLPMLLLGDGISWDAGGHYIQQSHARSLAESLEAWVLGELCS